MMMFDHRMVEGSPLHYYFTPAPLTYYSTSPNQFSYFQRFESGYSMSEEMLMPQSPNSAQSDSENSVCSVETSPKSSQSQRTNATVQCCWRSCGIVFDSLDQLATHVSKVHAASGPGGLFYCGWEGCTRNNRGFNARYKMLVHVRTHTNEKPHQCFQCEKSFSRAENLKIHTRSHSGEKPYVCPIPGCNKAYSNSSDRFKHTRTHQVEKPYQCKVPGCPKRYTDPSSLRKHVKTYKHFVNENAKSPEIVPVESEADCRKTCDCKHSCCVSNCLSKAAELLKLGTFINMRDTEINTIHWNKLLNPFVNEQKAIFTPYDLKSEMEIDGPLDLSISRK